MIEMELSPEQDVRAHEATVSLVMSNFSAIKLLKFCQQPGIRVFKPVNKYKHIILRVLYTYPVSFNISVVLTHSYYNTVVRIDELGLETDFELL